MKDHNKKIFLKGILEYSSNLKLATFKDTVESEIRNAQAVASLMNDMKGGREGTITNNFNVSQLVVREEADINRIAQRLQKLQDRENRKRGITNV